MTAMIVFINSVKTDLIHVQGEVGAAVHLDGDTTDILGQKKASYLDYVELWKSIMDPTKLKVIN